MQILRSLPIEQHKIRTQSWFLDTRSPNHMARQANNYIMSLLIKDRSPNIERNIRNRGWMTFQFHSWPDATDLLFCCPLFFGEVKKTINLCFFSLIIWPAQCKTAAFRDHIASFSNLAPALLQHLYSPKMERGHSDGRDMTYAWSHPWLSIKSSLWSRFSHVCCSSRIFFLMYLGLQKFDLKYNCVIYFFFYHFVKVTA